MWLMWHCCRWLFITRWFPDNMGEQIQQHYPLTVKFIPAIAWFIILSFAFIYPRARSSGCGQLVYSNRFWQADTCGCFRYAGPVHVAHQQIGYGQWQKAAFIKIALSISIFGLASEFARSILYRTQLWYFDWLADSIGSFTSFFMQKKFTGVKNKRHQPALRH